MKGRSNKVNLDSPFIYVNGRKTNRWNLEQEESHAIKKRRIE